MERFSRRVRKCFSSRLMMTHSVAAVEALLDAGIRAAIDESCGHLFSAAGYQPDLFAQSFAPSHQA